MAVKPSWPTVLHELNTTRSPNNPSGTDTWVDLTNRVRNWSAKRGRDDEQADVQAGVLGWEVLTPDAILDPDNAAGPYYGNLKVNRQGRTRVQWAYNLLDPNTATAPSSATWAPTNATVQRGPNSFMVSYASLQIICNANALTIYAAQTSSSNRIDVTETLTYTALAQVGYASASGRTASLSIQWFNSANGFISASSSQSVAVSTTGWTSPPANNLQPSALSVTAVAPTGAVTALIEVDIAAASTVNGESVQVVCPGLFTGTPAAWSPSGGRNLLDDNTSTIETDASGWVNNGNTTVAQSTVAIDGAVQRHGLHALKITSVAAGNLDVITSVGYPVVGGKQYSAQAWFLNTTTALLVRVDVVWFNAAGSAISQDPGTSLGENPGAYTRAVFNGGFAPATAVTARLVLQVFGAAAGNTHFVDDICFTQGTNAVYERTRVLTPLGYGYEESGFPQSYEMNGTYTKADLSFVDAIAVLGKIGLLDVYTDEVLTDAPAAFYPLNEPAGATQYGSTGATRVPTMTPAIRTSGTSGAANTGGHSVVTALPEQTSLGMAATVAAGDIWRLFVPASAFVASGSAFTVEFWLAPSTTAGGAFQMNQAVQGIGTPYGTLDLEVTSTGNLQLISRRTSSPSGNLYVSAVTTAASVTDGNGHHIAITLTGGNVWTLYQDGSAVTSVTVADGTVDPAQLTGSVYFQAAPVSIDLYLRLGQVAFYNTALSAGRILVHTIAGYAALAGQTVGARVTSLLGYASWLTSLQSVDISSAGDSDVLLQGATGIAGATLLQALQDAVNSAQGDLDVTADGKVRYRSRDYRTLQTSPVVVFGEFQDQGEVPYVDGITFGVDPSKIYAQVYVQQNGVLTVPRGDSTAQLDVFDSVLQKTTNALDPNFAIDLADGLLRTYKKPRTRCKTITVNPAANPAIWPAVLSLDFGSRVQVKRRTSYNGVAVTKTVDCYIEAIEHKVAPDSWTVTYTTSPVPAQQAWILGDSTFGLLGTTSVPVF